MTYETLSVDTDARGVVSLTLNLPETRNALSRTMIDELANFADTIGSRQTTRAVILRGAGKVFCAGGDLKWMKDQIDADRKTRMHEARKLAIMLKKLNEMPSPLIACIAGGAYGGGVGLASVCDHVIAEDSARFGLTETRLGLIPATISPYVLARLGEGNARQIFFSSRIFSAAEAAELGLVSKVVVASKLEETVAIEIEPYLSVAPNAVASAKALTRSLGLKIDDAVIDYTIQQLADCWETPEAKEGIEAFLNKTKPSWV